MPMHTFSNDAHASGKRTRRTAMAFLGVLWAVLSAPGCGGHSTMTQGGAGGPDPWPKPVVLPVENAPPLPGLSVRYYEKKIRHISEMPGAQTMDTRGKAGKPILSLAHRGERGQEVLGSGLSQGVCIQMRGLLRFPGPGDYTLKAYSNDGVMIFLDGRKIVSDPDVHADRFSSPSAFKIGTAGWYPILVRYFQRKGTSALQLHWKPPGMEDYEIVPAEALWHLPASP